MRKVAEGLKKIYARAEWELTEKVNSFFESFQRLDDKKLELVKAGKMSEAAYKDWRAKKLLMGEKYMDLRDSIADSMLHANEQAARLINGELPAIYVHNYNQVGKGIERKVKGYSFDLTNEYTVRKLATSKKTLLPYKWVDGAKDVRWNTKKVNSEILHGILQGDRPGHQDL